MVGVTYTEFQSWYNYGEIRICSSRVVDLETKPDGTPDPESPHVLTLLERIPQLSLQDEEGILLIQFKPLDIERDNYEILSPIDIFHTTYLPIECIRRVIPLTERACRILETRVGSFGVKISPAYFHKQVRETWFRFGVRKALRGGDSLVSTLFEEGLQIIDETLHKAVEFGIWELDYPDCSREEVSDKNIKWIAEAFKFTRYESYNYGELNYVTDAGAVMKNIIDSQDKELQLLGSLKRELTTAIKQKTSLVEVLKDTVWIQATSEMERDLLGTTSAGFTSLVLFLRWKEKFQKMNEKVDFKKLYEEAAEFAGSISFEKTVSAVWMFGCYVGYENIAPVVYASDPEMFSFYSLTEPRFTEKISKPEKTDEEGEKLPEDEKTAAAATMATYVAASKEDTETDAASKGKKKSTKKRAKGKKEKIESGSKTAEVAKEAITEKVSTSDKKSDEASEEKEEAEVKGKGGVNSSDSETVEESETSVPEVAKEVTAEKVTASDKEEDGATKESAETEAKGKEEKTTLESESPDETKGDVTDETSVTIKDSDENNSVDNKNTDKKVRPEQYKLFRETVIQKSNSGKK